MKAADIKTMTVDQIDDEVLKLKKEQFNLRFQRATGQLENTSRVREVRRDIARLKTVARQKRAGTGPVVVAPTARKDKVARTKKAAAPRSNRTKPKAKRAAAAPKKKAAAKSKSK